MKEKKETKFKKDFGNQATKGYSKEYMKVYCSWLHSLSKSKRKKMGDYNNPAPKSKRDKRMNKLYKKIVNGSI